MTLYLHNIPLQPLEKINFSINNSNETKKSCLPKVLLRSSSGISKNEMKQLAKNLLGALEAYHNGNNITIDDLSYKLEDICYEYFDDYQYNYVPSCSISSEHLTNDKVIFSTFDWRICIPENLISKPEICAKGIIAAIRQLEYLILFTKLELDSGISFEDLAYKYRSNLMQTNLIVGVNESNLQLSENLPTDLHSLLEKVFKIMPNSEENLETNENGYGLKKEFPKLFIEDLRGLTSDLFNE